MAKPIWAYGNNGKGNGKKIEKRAYQMHYKHEKQERVEVDCRNCAHATQIGEHEWECDAEKYFTACIHFCFVPRETETATD